jgi:hypothetical protein
LAIVAALLIAERLKTEPPLVNADAIWHPNQGAFDPYTTPATFSFRPGYRDELTVSIVSESTGSEVDVIARHYLVVAGHRTKEFFWNCRTTSGAPAPSGYYGVQVHFDNLDRTTDVPQVSFHLKNSGY